MLAFEKIMYLKRYFCSSVVKIKMSMNLEDEMKSEITRMRYVGALRLLQDFWEKWEGSQWRISAQTRLSHSPAATVASWMLASQNWAPSTSVPLHWLQWKATSTDACKAHYSTAFKSELRHNRPFLTTLFKVAAWPDFPGPCISDPRYLALLFTVLTTFEPIISHLRISYVCCLVSLCWTVISSTRTGIFASGSPNT